MKITNTIAWLEWMNNNTDEYGKAVVDYAKRWAELMEEKMEEGAKLEEIAQDTSRDADTEGITGFMYGAAVVILASCWEHGEQLRRWHNLDIQLGSEGEKANEEGGVLNPAILNVADGKG